MADHRLTRDPSEDERRDHPWSVTILRALNPDGSLLWDHQDISQYRATWQGGGDAIFLATWMQNAEAMAGDIFNPSTYQYYCLPSYVEQRPSLVKPGKMVSLTAEDLLADGQVQAILPDPRFLVPLQASDLALKKKDVVKSDRDYYARVNGYAGRDGRLYIDDVFQDRLTETRMIEDMVRAGTQRRCAAIGIESVSFQWLVTEHAARASHLPFVELNPEGRDKVLRARGLAARYNTSPTGMVYHRIDMPNLSLFEAQMTAFPNAAHDDMVDAVTYLHELAIRYASGNYARVARDLEDMRKSAQAFDHRVAAISGKSNSVGTLPNLPMPKF